jgi:hypothetical protein
MQKWKNDKGAIPDPETLRDSEKLRSCSTALLDYYSTANAKLES